jgi:carboxymethylenebutenolidase
MMLTAADQFQHGASRADPQRKPQGAFVVFLEILGDHPLLSSLCVRFAADVYAAIAPALFDRQQRDFQSGYSPEDVANARKFIANPDWALMAKDTQAAIDAVKSVGPVGVVGFCMGGTIAFLAATRLDGVKAAGCYYGGKIVAFADEKPRCPTQMHFGALDQGIPLTDVETIKQKRTDCEVFIYPDAGHGFHCDERASYHAPSAAQAWERTTAFLAKNLR